MKPEKILYEIKTGQLTDRDRAIDSAPDIYRILEEKTGCGIIIMGCYGGVDDPLWISSPGPRWLVKHLIERIADLEKELSRFELCDGANWDDSTDEGLGA